MSAASERALKMLATAMEKEERGRDFYLKATATCSNPLGKEIFRILASDEGVHLTRVKEIYEALTGGRPWTTDWRLRRTESEHLRDLFRKRIASFESKASSDPGDLEALDVGLSFEESAISFYENELAAAEDPIEREFVQAMIREERDHFSSLADVKLFLTDPDSWYLETERRGLDGA
jgi:rubrerythrin